MLTARYSDQYIADGPPTTPETLAVVESRACLICGASIF